MKKNPHVDNFLRIFDKTARSRHRYEVFKDFVTVVALDMYSAIVKMDSLEKLRNDTMKEYSDEDKLNFSKLLNEVVLGLTLQESDFLGHIFMKINISSERMGQFFTPSSISNLLVDLSIGFDIEKIKSMKQHEFIIINEPSCGSGGMVIAFFNKLKAEGINRYKVWVSCTDVDPLAAYMCYIQLTLCGIPGEVIIGDTITMEYRRSMKTLIHYIDRWGERMNLQKLKYFMNKI